MTRRNAVSAATLFVALFSLSGIAAADGKVPKGWETIMTLTTQEAQGQLGGLLTPNRTVNGCKRKGPAAGPGQRGHVPPGAAAPPSASDPPPCEVWPTHTGPWVEESKAELKDKKDGTGRWKWVYWKGTTTEGIDYEVTFQVSEGGAIPWRSRVMYKGDIIGTKEASALPGPND